MIGVLTRCVGGKVDFSETRMCSVHKAGKFQDLNPDLRSYVPILAQGLPAISQAGLPAVFQEGLSGSSEVDLPTVCRAGLPRLPHGMTLKLIFHRG